MFIFIVAVLPSSHAVVCSSKVLFTLCIIKKCMHRGLCDYAIYKLTFDVDINCRTSMVQGDLLHIWIKC